VPFVVPAVRFARISLVQTIVLLASLFAVAAVPASQAADTPKPPPGPNSDPTVHHQLGMDWGDRGYWKVVTPHEVAHQWWGHTVGFSSYRDQWMCEGFADMSASLCLSVIEKNPKKFITFWNDERELLLERNPQGFRAIDAGSLTMGYRTSNSRTGFDTTRRLIYPKGAYILHMIRR
jgi:Peptidase family M1 domain